MSEADIKSSIGSFPGVMLRTDWVEKAEADMESLRKSAEFAVAQLKCDFPHWPLNDVRRWAVIRFKEHCFVSVVGLCIMRVHLSRLDWWENYAPGSGKIIIEGGRSTFDKMVKGKFVLDMVGNLEHSIKLILRELDPTSKAHKFSHLYRSLFRNSNPYLDVVPNDWEAPFELLRRMRNSIHTAWLYEPEQGGDYHITYKGKDISLICGKPIECFSWDLLNILGNDLSRILITLVRDPKVSHFSAIPDPGAGPSFT